MPTLWFILVAGMLIMYVLLDGFDLGAGIIHLLVARSNSERRLVLLAIGPVWDGNEVWLIAAGGTLFFSFPLLYASSFSGFYLPLNIVLWLLVLRGIGIEFRMHIENQGRKSRCLCRMRLKFDSVAKLPECPDHSDRAPSLGLFAHRRAALLIANAFIQNHPDQLTETMRNRPDGFVVAETRNETTVDDLEDASFTFDGSIGGLIEKATHVPVPLRRARAVIHSRALFLSRACPYPRGEILG